MQSLRQTEKSMVRKGVEGKIWGKLFLEVIKNNRKGEIAKEPIESAKEFEDIKKKKQLIQKCLEMEKTVF